MTAILLRRFIAAAVALLMLLPTTAIASGVISADAEAAEAEHDAFVTGWTSAILSKDPARIAAMPHEEDYAHWSDDQKSRAVEDLFIGLETNRPAGAEPIVDEGEVAFVKGFLHGYIFERTAFEAAAEAQRAEVEALQDAAVETLPEGALDHSAQIDAASAPHTEALARFLALWAALHDGVRPEITLSEVQLLDTPPELDPVFEQLNPLLASIAGMSASGTYTLHVVSRGQEQIIRDVPLGVPIPVDADLDGTTGVGGIELIATLNIQASPEATYAVKDGVVSATAGGVGPALTIERVGDGAAGTPAFGPADDILIEAFVPLENGKQIARIGFDTRETGVPAFARVTLVPEVDAASGAPGALGSAFTAEEMNEDARATADMVAEAAGVALPWSDVDALPGEAEATAAAARQQVEDASSPARQQAEAILAEARANADQLVNGQLPALLAELETTVGTLADSARQQADETAAPAVALADEARGFYGGMVDEAAADAAETAKPATDLAHETAGFYGDLAAQKVGEARAAAQPAVDAAGSTLASVEAAAEPAVAIVDEAVDFYTSRADATLAEAAAAVEAARQETYATVVTANGEAGAIKNEYYYGDGATSLLPEGMSPRADLPSTPFDDAPGDVEQALGSSADSTGVRIPPRFTLAVESSGAASDLIVIGGFATRKDTADPFEEDATLVLRFAPAPALLTIRVASETTDTASVSIRTATPTAMQALLATRSGDQVTAAVLVLDQLPSEVDLRFTASGIEYDASLGMALLGVMMYEFQAFDDFVSWIETGSFTGRYAHALAAGLPLSFTVDVDDETGRLTYVSEGGRMLALEVAQAAFVENTLDGYLVRGRVSHLPTSFVLTATADASAFEASDALGSVEFERTNGLRLASPPPAFIVALRNGADDLVHLRVLGLQRLATADETISMDLAGGYPLVFDITSGETRMFGQFQAMPNHLGFAASSSGTAQTVDLTFLPSGTGVWAAMTNPDLGTDVAIVGISDLAGHVNAVFDGSGPQLDWTADRTTGGIFAGLYDENNAAKVALSFGQIPTRMSIGVDQFAQGFPSLKYSASASTMDFTAAVSGELLQGLGGIYLALVDIPRNGLSFSVLGNSYSIWSNGPERLGRWYMDISGIEFGGAFSYHKKWVNNWILQAGADVELAVAIEVRHFYLLVDNLRTMNVDLKAPVLGLSVDGVLTMAFDTLMQSRGYASMYVKALWGIVCLVCINISFDRSGVVPVNVHDWGYSWNVWRWNYITYPIGMCSWFSVKYAREWAEVGLRLPSGFTTNVNGYRLAYGSADVFVNPGGLVPTSVVWLYAAAIGFQHYFRSYTTHHCT